MSSPCIITKYQCLNAKTWSLKVKCHSDTKSINLCQNMSLFLAIAVGILKWLKVLFYTDELSLESNIYLD